MAAVLRLQGLNEDAGFEDIRSFFQGLTIPEGGVHIIGGKLGEAFIIFHSERAGQLAMLHSGKPIKGSIVTLYESSMVEFKHTMELKLRKRKCASMGSKPGLQTVKEMYSTLLSVLDVVKGLQSSPVSPVTTKVQSSPASPTQLTNTPNMGEDVIEKSPIADQRQPVKNPVRAAESRRPHVEEQQSGVREDSKPGYLRLYGLPNTITKEDVFQFLEGLKVVDVITDTLQGQDQCCLVKMASFKEAEEGLKYSSRSTRGFQVQVRLAHERMWKNAMELRENSSCSIFSEPDRFSPGRHLRKNSPGKRPCSSWGSPKRRRSNSPSFDTEYYVMVKNLPKNVTKSEIRALFACPDIPNSKILHLLNKWKERTSTAFIIFSQPEDYTSVMNMNGTVVHSKIIDVSSITKEKMKDLMYQNQCTEPERSRPCSSQTLPVLSCIYARNFRANVSKAEVKDFFSMYNISEEDVKLLEDENGNGIGEAVIQFACEEHAKEALGLHGERFRREQILLACISPHQMKEILHKTR
ncbi:hypothetical protein QTP86_025079 [Hemibagrus guttatus]|nr:hypothetical protein QTP86_025079 [Hemibagrus guttatus]